MKGKSLLCLALVTSMLLSVFVMGPVGAQSTTIGVEPDSIVDTGLGPGSTFTVDIWIRDVENLAGFEFKLGYNTAVLTATLIEYGGIFPVYMELGKEIHEAEGWLGYAVMVAPGEPPFSGDGCAAIIHFTVDSWGGSVLDLYDTILASPPDPSDPMTPIPIPHDALDGYFTNMILPPPPPSTYTRIYISNQWISDGVAMGWHADDNSWTYPLPFYFPFYGTYYGTIYISSNGLITFVGPDYSYSNSIGWLATKLAIAPAWDDWVTYSPYDIYIWQPDPAHVIIRWYAQRIGTSIVANFEAILGQDGVIQFNYGYNDGPISATVGISNGVDDILAEDVTNLNYINSIVFTPYRLEHELEVSLTAPQLLPIGGSTTLNATVFNFGQNDETDVGLSLLIDGVTVSSATIPELLIGTSYTLNYIWTPIAEGTYNITAYAPPVPEEEFTANNRATKFVTVTQPLIKPEEGQWANYKITSTEKATNISQVMFLNSTYSRYISPCQMNVTLWMTDPWGGTMTTWLILNVMTRQVEAGTWAGMWSPLWIETNVTVGSFVKILGTTGTVIGSRFVEVGEHLVDSWELQALYGISYIFLFDKVTGLVTGIEGDDPYYHQHWELTATNILKLLPEEALEEMIETIETWNLPKRTKNSLTSKLDDAIHLLDKGNENGAIHKLMDFISQVKAFRGKKLTNEQADQLISEAQRIVDVIKE